MVVPTPDGVVNPLVLAAADIAGVDEIYRIGGAQAVAALAYGTATIAPVDKIVGPGQRLCRRGQAAGVRPGRDRHDRRARRRSWSWPRPWSTRTGSPPTCCRQAEHDERAQAILITDDAGFAEPWWRAVEAQLAALERGAIAGASWREHGAVRRWSRRIEEAAGAGRCAGARASRADRPARRGAGGHDPPCRRDLPRAVHARGDRRLCRRPEPRAADRPHRPLRLGPRRLRLPQAHHAPGLRPRRLRAAGAGRGRAGPGRGAGGARAGGRAAARGCRHERRQGADRRARARPEEHRALEPARSSTSATSPIFDLLEDNHFRLVDGFAGPYRVVLSLRESNLVLRRCVATASAEPVEVVLSHAAVPPRRQGLLHDLRQLLPGDQGRHAVAHRGDRHGAARPAQRRLRRCCARRSRGGSSSTTTPPGACSRWSACCTSGADGRAAGQRPVRLLAQRDPLAHGREHPALLPWPPGLRAECRACAPSRARPVRGGGDGRDRHRHLAPPVAQLRPARRRLFRPGDLAVARGAAQCGRADPQQPLRAAVLAHAGPEPGRGLARDAGSTPTAPCATC